HLYAAVLGDIYGPGPVRGVYETTDGGQSWDQILSISDDTGFNDIEMDPSNPRILFATAWTVYRKPWSIHSGSEEGGVYRSKDGGETWDKLSGGLPGGVVGKIDVTVSPPNPERVWALVEAPNDRGGVYRSENGGDSWQRVNDTRNLQQRAWYYVHIYADPVDPDTVYALNTGAYKSTDGGATFNSTLRPSHGDNHDLWINPDNPQIMVNGNDGGANVSLNGGQTFTDQMNQPTAEFYRVTVDNGIPYRVYGAQQDNSTAAVAATGGGGRGGGGFYSVGGGDSGHIAVDPRDNNVIWAGSYGGNFTRQDRNTGITRSVRIYADAETGQQAADMKYRFQWNAPIRISPHDPDTVYITSQFVHRTRDDGVNWEVISPDLTTNDITKQGYSGGEGITRDSTGVEVYTTVFAFEESPLTAGLLWA
ncbi:MAG: glycosyl hydrolase, partial [bacterium]|nr:glycosyl hydrolase [bacterium]